ncbi:hypothetical protein Tco_0605331 [Tanacetum coccineum]
MTGAKFDIKKFDRTGDFGLWRMKMRALLIQRGCEAALKVLPANMKDEVKAKLNKNAHSAMILCLASYEHFMDVMLYRRKGLNLEDMMVILKSKEIKERSKAKGDNGEGLYTRGRTDCRDSHQNCPKNNCKKSKDFVKKDDQPSSSGLIYNGCELILVMSAKVLLDWIMDSGVGLPKTFLAEAISTVTYLISRSPSITIEKMTPIEMCSGHPDDYGMLRVFGHVAYSQVKQGTDKSVEELQVEMELQGINNHTLKEDQTNQEDEDDEDARD